jgi:predicted site-specific integrase-resolvase
MNCVPNLMSIREVARTGVLSEYTLRLWERQGRLPCVYSGRKCLINYDRLCEMLNQLGSQNGGEAIER